MIDPKLSAGYEEPDVPSLEDLQDAPPHGLLGQRYFRPTKVELKLKYDEKRKESYELAKTSSGELLVTIKNVAKHPASGDTRIPDTCYVALGFDTADYHMSQKILKVEKVGKGKTAEAKFDSPGEWVRDIGPRWIAVLISLTPVTEDELRKERSLPGKTTIRFSVHPMVVNVADEQTEEGNQYEEDTEAS